MATMLSLRLTSATRAHNCYGPPFWHVKFGGQDGEMGRVPGECSFPSVLYVSVADSADPSLNNARRSRASSSAEA